ncbi:ABC transporter permease [Neobacillus sp. LXY-1]|uniref:ABC transporter permease n=1 Tax=Neobacillus sp. LXY-1 TaxID=3379133 RepID=UPI003EDEECF3
MVKRKTQQSMLMILLALFFLIPFIPLLIWSFTKQWPWPHVFPEKWSLGTWKYVLSASGSAKEGGINSLIVAFLTLFGNLVLGIPAARVLAQNEFIGKKLVFIFILTPLFIPFTVSIFGLHQMALQADFLNEYIKVSIAHILVTMPYFIAAVWYQFRLMGTKLQEAAKSLGASEWLIIRRIEMPLLLPSIYMGSLMVIIISFSQYLPTWIMSGGTLLTLPLVIFPYADSGNSSIVSAYSIVFFIPIFILLIVYSILIYLNKRRFVKGKEGEHASEGYQY